MPTLTTLSLWLRKAAQLALGLEHNCKYVNKTLHRTGALAGEVARPRFPIITGQVAY